MKAAVEQPNGRKVEMHENHQFRFEKLSVWQSARRLSGGIYSVTESFPREEMFGLTSQIRRAAVSIAANIAEGSGRNSDADFAHFLEIAYGSAMELASLLYLAGDAGKLGVSVRDTLLGLIGEVTAQITALNRSLRIERSKTPFPRRKPID